MLISFLACELYPLEASITHSLHHVAGRLVINHIVLPNLKNCLQAIQSRIKKI